MANQMLAERNAEIKQQNEEILSQRDELKIKNDKIETQNRDIIASINYAARIQKVLITQKDILNKLLPQNMLFFKPRNIVSGDFYWAKEISKNKIAFAAADCTGHGVPGALMSVLGVTYLNETVNDLIEELGVDNVLASSVLDLMRDRIKNMLNQEDLDSETKDGMDMAFCIIDYEKMQLDFAGANNPIFLIRKIGDNYELTEYKADKMPIGISFSRKRNFLNHKIDIQKNDIIYCFSDGIVDQFGGDNNQKYYKANFKKFLLTIQNLNLENQKIAIKKELESWMQFKYDQTDDILVLAVKI
jgi:serine phosphatase RsbU (regulator of sigma subunit)